LKDKFLNTIVPQTAALEITYDCNHKCVFCSVPWDSPRKNYARLPELSIAEWKECIKTLVGHGIKSIAFTGGEPLLKLGIIELIEYAGNIKVKEPIFNSNDELIDYKDIPLKMSLITNGELIDDKWIKLFKKYSIDLVVSLPGSKTFKEHTGGGDYQKVMGSISKLSKAGLNVVIGVCVTKKNLPELFETIALGFLNGANQLLLNRFLPGGRGTDRMELCLNKDEVTQMFDLAEEACTAANTYGSVGTEVPKCVITKEYKMLKIGTMCSGGIDFFAVDPSGRVRPCNHSPVTTGTYKDIISAIRSDYWQTFKNRDFLPKECGSCQMAIECDGGCREAAHIIYGKIDSLDPLLT